MIAQSILIVTFAICVGIVLLTFLICRLFLAINKDHVQYNRITGQPYCKSCLHSHCYCGLGFHNEQDLRAGRRKKVRGKRAKKVKEGYDNTVID